MENTLDATFENPIKYAFFAEGNFYIATEEKTFSSKNNLWKENFRFSHFIDLDDTWRAGFIDSDNLEALKLGNYDENLGSVLLLLNRKNGKIYEVARGLEIMLFFIFDGKIIFQTKSEFYEVKIPDDFTPDLS